MSNRVQCLQEIQEAGFEIDDLTLYLDTHPLDTTALESFNKARERRYELLKNYARDYEPLNLYLVDPANNNETESYSKYLGKEHFTWTDGPLPWDNQGGV
ncbi:MAG: spore coat protein CotJB [Clostridiales bacterium]|nr:spore coat protein CotJB [Clostridiales bacterium]